MEEYLKATLIHKGKTIKIIEGDISELPRKNTYIKIQDTNYFIESFSILDDDVFYILT